MGLSGENALLRIFVNSRLQHELRPLYELLLMHARQAGLAGATVLQGTGTHGQAPHGWFRELWQLGREHEMILELVDTRARLEAFLREAEPLLTGCIATFERARVIYYGAENLS